MKAILVMDMPSSCSKCDFCEHQDEGWLWCSRCKKTARAFDKPDWCPLKPAPQKQPTEMKTINDDINKLVFNEGYNACIDEILGDKE